MVILTAWMRNLRQLNADRRSSSDPVPGGTPEPSSPGQRARSTACTVQKTWQGKGLWQGLTGHDMPSSWPSSTQELASQPHLHQVSSLRPLAPSHDFLTVSHGRWKLPLSNHMTPPYRHLQIASVTARHHQDFCSSSCRPLQQFLIPLSSIIRSSCPRVLSFQPYRSASVPTPSSQSGTTFTQILAEKQSHHENREDFKRGLAKTLCTQSPRTRRTACVGLILVPVSHSPFVKMGN